MAIVLDGEHLTIEKVVDIPFAQPWRNGHLQCATAGLDPKRDAGRTAVLANGERNRASIHGNRPFQLDRRSSLGFQLFQQGKHAPVLADSRCDLARKKAGARAPTSILSAKAPPHQLPVKP